MERTKILANNFNHKHRKPKVLKTLINTLLEGPSEELDEVK